MSYWCYQHLGNLVARGSRRGRLSTARCATREGDAGAILRDFAFRADREVAGARWSYKRDIGRTRIVVDGLARRARARARRALDGRRRRVGVHRGVDGGDFDHLLLGTSLPVFLGRGMHYLEAFDEARLPTARGASWPRALARRCARALDLEHWAAFGDSLRALEHLLERRRLGPARRRARGPSCCSPATCTTPTSPTRALRPTGSDRTAPRSTRPCARRCATRWTRASAASSARRCRARPSARAGPGPRGSAWRTSR